MGFDAHANFATSIVATAPEPADTGNTLVVKSGEGSRFTGTPPYNCTVKNPNGDKEIVRVTARSGNTFTISRNVEAGGTAISILPGATFTNTITGKTLTDIENVILQPQVLQPKLYGKAKTGFGVNYHNMLANVDEDIAYFKRVGISTTRQAYPTLDFPYTSGNPATINTLAYYRSIAQTFKANGFWTVWNVGGLTGANGFGQLNSSNWPNFRTSLLAELQYLQDNNIVFDIVEIGNELELKFDGTTITYAQGRALQRALAVDAKAVYTLGAIGLAISNGNGAYAGWTSEGIGVYDFIDIHAYGHINTTTQAVAPIDFTGIAAVKTAFGAKAWLGEFNLDSVAANIANLSPQTAANYMKVYYEQYIVPLNFSRFTVWEYCETNQHFAGEAGFAMLRSDGRFNPMWFLFFDEFNG